MSLAVWLPLNGDLHNQGLSSTTFSGTAAYKSYGKLGGQSLSLQNRITCSTPALNGVQFFSIAFWCRIEDNPDSTANWMDVIGFTDQKSDNSANGQFRFETGYLSDSEGGIHWHDNDIYAIIMGSNKYNTAAQRNEWHHIVVTVANNSVKSYYDGALQNTQTTSLNKGHLTGSWWLGQSTTRGCIQDVRIYDHCLSPKEVEEIAKGLVLHYKLDNNGMGGENLLANSKLDGSWTYPSSSYSDKYSPITIKVPSGSVYTLSFEAKSTVNGDKIKTYYYSPNTTTTGISNQGVTKNAPDGNMDFTLTTAWKKYWVTYNQSSTTEVKHIICPRLFSGQGTGTVSVRNVKLEEGNKATAWSPALSDAIYPALYKTTIYDSSGYSNNGTIIGNLGIAAPSPRYDVATHLESSSPTTNNNTGLTYIQTAFRLTTPTQMTICWWGHPESGLNGNSNHAAWCTSASSSAPTDYDQTAFHHRDKRFDICLNSASSTSLSLRFDNYTLNEWHYYSVTYDGKNAILYKDGIETNRSTISSSEAPLKTFSYLYIGFSKAGGVYRKTLGSYSDFRIYATALSAQQIKELYNTSMQIDSSGNVFARELVEL